MILINLLPHREAARKRRKEAFQVAMFASFLMGLAIAAVVYWWFQMMIGEQQGRNAFLQSEIQVLEGQIKEIATIEEEIAALRARQKAVEDLQSDRNLPVHLLSELVRQLPDGVYITSLKQADQVITMQGMAQSNERVSEMLRNLADNTPWFSKPELVEIVATNVALTPRDQRRVASFNVRFRLMRTSEAQKAMDGASAPRAAGGMSMATRKKTSVDFGALQDSLQRQFRNLDPKDPSLWPPLPRLLLCVFIAVAVAAFLWFFKINEYQDELDAERAKEVSLREDYQRKLVKAVSLDALKKQREQVQQYVIQLEKQLPSKAEMAALLSDINQAGLGRSLQFELFRPGQVVVRDYYAELPIAIRVTGKYHDIGAFAADIANLSRIVTLNNIALSPANAKDAPAGSLSMDATARTFRYLDPDEIQAQRKAAGGKK